VQVHVGLHGKMTRSKKLKQKTTPRIGSSFDIFATRHPVDVTFAGNRLHQQLQVIVSSLKILNFDACIEAWEPVVPFQWEYITHSLLKELLIRQTVCCGE